MCSPADRNEKRPRMSTPSRSFWRRSRWDIYPRSNSWWTRPACQVTLNLKRWVLLLLEARVSSSVQSLILFLCPSDAVLSNSSDAEVWKQIQDVFSHYSLLEAGHHRSPIQLWGAVISSTFLKIALKESLIMLRIICFVQQLRGSALSVGVWQSTSVFSVCQIANCTQGESNSTVPPVMHR